MSRIQQVLDKAEREGRVRRTTAAQEAAAPAAAAPPGAAATSLPPGAREVPRPAPVASPVRATSPVASPVVTPLRTADAHLGPIGIAANEPQSTAAEQYRALRTRIAQSETDRYFRAIVVTSPSQGDGKSVTAMNLALAMAQEFHRRVLLVDADLRNGSLHRQLGIPGRPGLADVLTGTATLDEAIVSIPACRLAVIPSGGPADHPTELLGSAEMRRLLDTLRTQFDRIVLDTPPAAPLADVNVLAPLADGVLLVVRAGRTGRPAIDRAVEGIDESHIIGLVLNDVDVSIAGYAYQGRDGSTGRRPGRAPLRIHRPTSA
jgi:capsular exopolysaccharide synthesis family protein